MRNDKKIQKYLKIIIPVMIIVIVMGIWFIKNSNENVIKKSGTDNLGSQNVDFLLETTELDMEQLKSYGLPIVIDFGADSCIPCKEMAPVLQELNDELRGKAIVKFVDVWKYQRLAEGFPISVIPTQVFFDKEGKPYIPSDPQGMGMQMYSTKDSGEHVFTTHEGGMTKNQILAVLSEMGMEE